MISYSDEAMANGREEIERLFPGHGLSASLLNDCVRFSIFLSSLNGDLTKALHELEEEVASSAADKGALSSALTSFEAEWEFAIPFNQETESYDKVELIGPLNGAQFRAQLRSGRTFKDPTILGEHGEFTHRIQWCLAGLAKLFQNPITAVYKAVGTVELPNDPRYGLWDHLCDRNENEKFLGWLMPKGDTDFRCAAHLNVWLCRGNGASLFRRLSAQLNKKLTKRNNQKLLYGANFQEEYFAKKVYGRAFKDLSEQEQAEIRRGANQVDDKPGSVEEQRSLERGTGVFTRQSDGKYKSGY